MHFRLWPIIAAALASGLAVAANVIISPNMGMPVPVVGTDPGPDWANNINASLSIIDSHDHTPGFGVQVPPAGLNINSDLTFQSNNATSLRSTRYTAQSAPLALAADLGVVYVSGVDLYYNDENGNQVRITQGGSVTGSSGTITGLPSGSASASFASSTFTFQSATNTPAKMAVGPVAIGTNAVSPKTVTLAPPGGLAANYNLTFPNGLPGSTSFLNVDTSGNMATVATTGTGSVVLATSPTMTGATLNGTTTVAALNSNGGSLSGIYSGNPELSGHLVVDTYVTISGTGGNTPHACTIRTATGTISATSSCSAGEIVLGGSCEFSTGSAVNNHPTSTSWVCSITSGSGLTAYAICCSI